MESSISELRCFTLGFMRLHSPETSKKPYPNRAGERHRWRRRRKNQQNLNKIKSKFVFPMANKWTKIFGWKLCRIGRWRWRRRTKKKKKKKQEAETTRTNENNHQVIWCVCCWLTGVMLVACCILHIALPAIWMHFANERKRMNEMANTIYRQREQQQQQQHDAFQHGEKNLPYLDILPSARFRVPAKWFGEYYFVVLTVNGSRCTEYRIWNWER